MVKWKIGVALVLLIFFLPMIANAEETTKVYSIGDITSYRQKGWDDTVYVYFNDTVERAEVGEPLLIEGYVKVLFKKNNEVLEGFISDYPFVILFYKNGMDIEDYYMESDNIGKFIIPKTKYGGFVPRESGYYKVYTRGFYDFLPCKSLWPLYFYVSISKKDSDDDGVHDCYDYDPYDPNIQSRSDIKTPAFEVIFAIVGLFAVSYLLRRRR
jgi:hypothetical protein